jgi:2-polyprenyl-3-methyl-5-hydroxy-6-metoxy-1,4-benzoquinol methylase
VRKQQKEAEVINGSYAKDGSEMILKGANILSSSSSVAYSHRLLIATKYLNLVSTKENIAKVLDIGCSNGGLLQMQQTLARDFNTKTLHYVGVDIREKPLLELRRFSDAVLSERQRKMVFEKMGDICDIEFVKSIYKEHGKFDFVSAMEVIEHIPVECVSKFLKNIFRLLNDNGTLVVSTPIHFKEEPMFYPSDHVKEYTRNEMREMLEEYFEIESEIGCFVDSKILKQILKSGSESVWNLYKSLTDTTKMNSIINNIFGMAYPTSCKSMIFVCKRNV